MKLIRSLNEEDRRKATLGWFRNKDRWQKLFPWLYGVRAKSTGHLYLGCAACRDARLNGAFANFAYMRYPLMRFNFAQHELGPVHVAAVQHLLIQDKAPTKEDFQEVYEGTLHRKFASCAGRKKLRKMQWCLSEAARSLDRDFLKDAQSICLMQDGRANRHMVRFRACSSQLLTRSGVLQQLRLEDESAHGVKACTIECILKACNPWLE